MTSLGFIKSLAITTAAAAHLCSTLAAADSADHPDARSISGESTVSALTFVGSASIYNPAFRPTKLADLTTAAALRSAYEELDPQYRAVRLTLSRTNATVRAFLTEQTGALAALDGVLPATTELTAGDSRPFTATERLAVGIQRLIEQKLALDEKVAQLKKAEESGAFWKISAVIGGVTVTGIVAIIGGLLASGKLELKRN